MSEYLPALDGLPWHWIALGLLGLALLLLGARHFSTKGNDMSRRWWQFWKPEPEPTAPVVAVVAPVATIVTSGVFIDRDDFMKAISQSLIATYLDGVLVHNGVPGVNFYTQANGTISTVPQAAPAPKPAPAVAYTPIAGYDHGYAPAPAPAPAPVTPSAAGFPMLYNDHLFLTRDELETYMRAVAVRDSNLAGNVTEYNGDVDYTTLQEADWKHYLRHPEIWGRLKGEAGAVRNAIQDAHLKGWGSVPFDDSTYSGVFTRKGGT
ncbi:MAG: hypothetical protein ABIX12_07535, partial [Rubrivivax sp.]